MTIGGVEGCINIDKKKKKIPLKKKILVKKNFLPDYVRKKKFDFRKFDYGSLLWYPRRLRIDKKNQVFFQKFIKNVKKGTKKSMKKFESPK